MKKTKSVGILLFTKNYKKFLLMEHKTRWDLPKGHTDKGETELETAFREFEEETGISREDITIIPEFEYKEKYIAFEKKYKKECKKTLIIYLAVLKKKRKEIDIVVTEHIGYKWFKWLPPMKIQERVIDSLLAKANDFLREIRIDN